MKIETKFNVGQKVFYLKNSILKEAKIHSIDIEILEDKTTIQYCFRHYICNAANFEFANESRVFGTRDEFLKSEDEPFMPLA